MLRASGLFGVLGLFVGASVGCTVGAPAGFSSGDRWVLPLVGPLEDGLLLTPATVRGHGPYLFAIDPDANVTEIDAEIVQQAQLRTGVGPHRIDETDTGQVRFYAEMLQLQVGGLTVDRRDAMVFPIGFYDTEGRHINGILGRDALADSLVFGFDRDQGIATLSTIKAFTPPPGAIEIHYQDVSNESNAVDGREPAGTLVARGGGDRGAMITTPYDGVPGRLAGGERVGTRLPDVVPVTRRLATVQIGGASFAMHLDLGAAVSQLRETKWAAARLSTVATKLRVTDEAATARDVTRAALAGEVTVGRATSTHATFVPYVERRFVVDSVDGALGLDFFQPYAVFASWDARTYYLKPRGDAAARLTARLGRWGRALPACPHPGCVTAELSEAAGSVILTATRDPQATGRGLEVLLQVTAAPGKTAAPLLVELPAATDKLTGALPAGYRGATFAVLDAAPFPRACFDKTGCLLPLGVAPDASAEPAHEPSAPPDEPTVAAPKLVAFNRLHRVSGAAEIPPSEAVAQAAGGKPLAVAILKVCLGADGKVDSTKLAKSSGVPAYDDELLATIKTTWVFEPVQVEGVSAPVCTTASLKAP